MQSFKYIGVTLTTQKQIGKEYVTQNVKKASKYQCWLNNILRGKINKIAYGKTLWKGMVLPRILHVISAINITKNQLIKLDTTQNKFLRQLLELPKYASKPYLINEIEI